MEMKKFELVNLEGCLMETILLSSFKKARKYFAGKYEGKYKIICEGETKNVRL